MLLRQHNEGKEAPEKIVFDEYFLGHAGEIKLVELAEVRVRPITFVPEDELRELAARLIAEK